MAETKTAPTAKTNGAKVEEKAKVGAPKRTDEELKKMGVVGSLILITKKAVKLAKRFAFEGLDVPAEVDAESIFYRVHKNGGVIERLNQSEEPFTKLRELAKKAVPDLMKYSETASATVQKSAYTANVKGFLKHAAGLEIERKQAGLDMSALKDLEL